ncbi:hypothetical protein Tco_1531903, partial [Tanacetum coccineum]
LVEAHTKQLQQHQLRLDDLSKINVVDIVEEFVGAHAVNEVKNQLPNVDLDVILDFIRPRLKSTMLRVLNTEQIHLFTRLATTTESLTIPKMKLRVNMMSANPQPHDDWDPPKSRELEKKRKKQKLAGKSTPGKAPVITISTYHDTQPSSADQPRDNEAWFNKNVQTSKYDFSYIDENSKEHGWFNIMVDANEDPKDDESIQVCSTIMFAKKLNKCFKWTTCRNPSSRELKETSSNVTPPNSDSSGRQPRVLLHST